jgi:predicted nucleic acid-binding protein
MMVDTSVVIDLFLNDEGSKDFLLIMDSIKDEDLFISVIQIGELSDWCYRNRIDPSEVLGFIKKISEILPIDEGLIEEASRLKYNARTNGHVKFSLIDGIILSTAYRYEEILLTRDNDFRDLDGVAII